MTNGSLMKVESTAECSHWDILQYFWPALSDNYSWKQILAHFESGRFTQVVLYDVHYVQLQNGEITISDVCKSWPSRQNTICKTIIVVQISE